MAIVGWCLLGEGDGVADLEVGFVVGDSLVGRLVGGVYVYV